MSEDGAGEAAAAGGAEAMDEDGERGLTAEEETIAQRQTKHAEKTAREIVPEDSAYWASSLAFFKELGPMA